MRASQKTIEFDFAFAYPKDGQYAEARSITVCEPGFDNRAVFRRMGSYVADAQKNLIKIFAGASREKIEKDVEDAGVVKPAEPGDDEALGIMQMGLEGSAYEDMLKYVERVLSGNKLLAYVGSDPDSKVAITEEVWRNIADAGGLAEMERIHGAFVGFFVNTPSGPTGSPTKNGTSKPSTQRVQAPVPSQSKPH